MFLRKIDRKSDWGHDADIQTERLGNAVSKVFHGCDNRFSIYCVDNNDDLRAVVVGLNSGRHSPNQQLDFVAFTEDEFQTVGIELERTAGKTNCGQANRLHLDAHFKDVIDLSRLCQLAMYTKRLPFRISRSEAKSLSEDAAKNGCGAVVSIPGCGC